MPLRILLRETSLALIILAGSCFAHGRSNGVDKPAQQVDHPKHAVALEGTRWNLIELGGAAASSESDEGKGYLVLNADGERLFGSSGCNSLLGGYTLQGRSLRFTKTGLTRKACPEPLMKQEQAFVQALDATTNYRIVGDSLELRESKRVLAKFQASPESNPPADQAGTLAGPENLPDKWLGQWNGPEGTYLLLSKQDDRYLVKIQSLDGPNTYEGSWQGDRIQFTRDNTTESIHAGDGKETGMKWLLDKKNCLIIKTGEGFCRN